MKNNLTVKSFSFSILTTFFCVSLLFSQKVEWEKTYGGLHADYLYDIQPMPDYGFILAGSSVSDVGGSKSDAKVGVMDFWLWKMSETGKLEWQRSYGGDGIDKLNSLVITRDGGMLLGGTSNSQKGFDKSNASFGGDDFWVLRLDPFGNIIWQKTYGGKGEEKLTKVIETEDGGFLIGGSSSSNRIFDAAKQTVVENAKSENTRGNLDYWVLKVDAQGEIQWQRTLGGRYADILKTVVETPDGGYLLGGISNSPESGDKTDKNLGEFDFWIVKLDAEGETLWQRTMGGEADDHLVDITLTESKKILIAGYTNSGVSFDKEVSNRGTATDAWVILLDEQGGQLWQKTYNIDAYTILTSVTKTSDSAFVLGGYSQKGLLDKTKKGTVNSDYFALKIDSLGEQKWKRELGSSSRDVLSKIVETRDGGYILAGTSDGKVSKSKQSGNVGLEDFWIVKLGDEDKDKKPKRLIEAYPNPTNNVTNVLVGFDFDRGTATLVDIAGRQLQYFEINSRTVPVSLQGLPIGIYLITIKTDKGSETIKILKGN
tara:strand:+ start:25926 stop:27551 length:1626 start_codon:yes stop_codon:yes gene_type:complete